MVKLCDKYIKPFVTSDDLLLVKDELTEAYQKLYSLKDRAAGSEMQGFLTLPADYDKDEFEDIKQHAEKIRSDSEVFIVIGIGGSYLGARAVIEFLKSKDHNLFSKDSPKIFFLGNSLSPSELSRVFDYCKDRDFSVNVVSKSGSTTEPAVAFRFFKSLLEEKYGKEGAAKRIYATTDKSKGALKDMALKEGYKTFTVPDDIGGRYSVLTPVGLLPIAVAGVDIDALLAGALEAMNDLSNSDVLSNDCALYAAYRNILLRRGKTVEIMVSYEPDFQMMNEWFKQLFGESEGKDGKGVYPSSAIYSTDLHSLGQYVQDGMRQIFETVVLFKEPKTDLTIGFDEDNGDGLNYIAGRTMSYVNEKAFEGTCAAHVDGSVPNIVLEVDKQDEFNLGYLIYFLEKSCAISGYMLKVNPFDQPGVEKYKRNMFKLLGKE